MSGSSVSYNEKHNIYLSNGYTSAAGNTYFQGIRLSDRLIVKYDFGQGYAYLFLNGIRLYCHDGYDTKLISSRGYYRQGWNESFARHECLDMLKDYLLSQTRMLRQSVPQSQIEDFAAAMVKSVMATQRPRLR